MAEVDATEVPRALRDMYDKGKEALKKNNFDYAITLFDNVLRKVPGFYACREALRATQYYKSQKGSSLFKKLFSSANPMIAKAQVELRTNPLNAIQTLEQILNKDPQNVTAHKMLADAALEAGMPKTAVLSLEIVFRKNQADRDNALKLGQALGLVGRSDKGEEILAALKAAFPGDSEVAQVLKNFSAKRTLNESGYEGLSSGQGSYRDILKDKDAAVAMEQEQREVKTAEVAESLIASLERRLEDEPQNFKLIRQIGDLCVQKGDFDRGIEYYKMVAAAHGGNDPSLQRVIAQTELKRFDVLMNSLDPHDPEVATKRADYQRQRDVAELADCRARSAQFPNDLELRFELGQLLYKQGEFGDAIKELQKAQNHPHRKLSAMKLLGICFSRRNIHDLAVKTLTSAISQKELFDAEKKEMLYELALAYEKMGRAEDSITAIKEIYAEDVEYRDVSDRIDTYYASQS